MQPTPGAPGSEPTFPQAIEITAQWLQLWEAGELSDEVLADRVAELVASRDGARGFFVVALAGVTGGVTSPAAVWLVAIPLEALVSGSLRATIAAAAMARPLARAGWPV